MRNYIALALAASVASADQATCDIANWEFQKVGQMCTRASATADITCTYEGDDEALGTDIAIAGIVTALDVACGSLTPATLGSATYDEAKCTEYKNKKTTADATWTEPATLATMDYEYAKVCYQGATGVTVFGAAIVAAIAALAF